MNSKLRNIPKKTTVNNHFDYMLNKLIESEIQTEIIKENERVKTQLSLFSETMDLYEEQLNTILQEWKDTEESDIKIDEVFNTILKYNSQNISYFITLGNEDINVPISEQGVPITIHLYDNRYDDNTPGGQISLIIDYYKSSPETMDLLNTLRLDLIERKKDLEIKQKKFNSKKALLRSRVTKRFINSVIKYNNVDKYFDSPQYSELEATDLLINTENFLEKGDKINGKR